MTPLPSWSGHEVVADGAEAPSAMQARSQQLPVRMTHMPVEQTGDAHSMRHVDGGESAHICALAVAAMAARVMSFIIISGVNELGGLCGLATVDGNADA